MPLLFDDLPLEAQNSSFEKLIFSRDYHYVFPYFHTLKRVEMSIAISLAHQQKDEVRV